MKRDQKAEVKKGCVVCGETDARTLATAPLKGGLFATLCGSHDLAYRRSLQKADTVEELKELVKNRRGTRRRSTTEVDELGLQLTQAFSRERRAGRERRSA